MRNVSASLVLALSVVVPACSGTTEIPRETRHGLPLGTVEEVGIDAAALATLEDDADRAQTDALVIIKDGLLVYENYFDSYRQPSVLMSASKSFVNLAVGYLIAEGKLALEQPGADFIPGWAGDPLKSQITIRQLLAHTSGLDAGRAMDPVTSDLFPLEQWLVETPQDTAPDQLWIYNNGAIDGLALIAERAAGESLESYLDARLFEPIGARGGQWGRYPDGGPMGAGEFVLDPIDMAKVGRLLAHDGIGDDGARIIPEGWMSLSMTSTTFEPTNGRLWWKNVDIQTVGLTQPIVDYWASHGISADIIGALGPVIDTPYASYEQVVDAIRGVLTQAQLQQLDAKASAMYHFPVAYPLSVGPMKGYMANGWLGQYLFVYPEQDLVIARLHYPTDADYGSRPPNTEFRELPADAVALVGEHVSTRISHFDEQESARKLLATPAAAQARP